MARSVLNAVREWISTIAVNVEALTWTIFKCFCDLYILNCMDRFWTVFWGFQKATFSSKDRTTLMVPENNRTRLTNVLGGDLD
eukprot:COSAG03_NODE_448_length_7836_cov_82.194649_7_plen_83_part_00